MRLFSTHDEAVYDYLAFRKDLEGLAAERAARIGSDTDLKVINAIYKKMEVAQSKRSTEEEARLDAQFHMSICEAGHNVVMLHMMRSMYELLQTGVFYNRRQHFDKRVAGHNCCNNMAQLMMRSKRATQKQQGMRCIST
jgi:GntR family transcriptional repressor for pyruvate dehydrogenase complex